MLTEEQNCNGRWMDILLKALRSVIEAEQPIEDVEALQNLKNVGPRICKVDSLCFDRSKMGF